MFRKENILLHETYVPISTYLNGEAYLDWIKPCLDLKFYKGNIIGYEI